MKLRSSMSSTLLTVCSEAPCVRAYALPRTARRRRTKPSARGIREGAPGLRPEWAAIARHAVWWQRRDVAPFVGAADSRGLVQWVLKSVSAQKDVSMGEGSRGSSGSLTATGHITLPSQVRAATVQVPPESERGICGAPRMRSCEAGRGRRADRGARSVPALFFCRSAGGCWQRHHSNDSDGFARCTSTSGPQREEGVSDEENPRLLERGNGFISVVRARRARFRYSVALVEGVLRLGRTRLVLCWPFCGYRPG